MLKIYNLALEVLINFHLDGMSSPSLAELLKDIIALV